MSFCLQGERTRGEGVGSPYPSAAWWRGGEGEWGLDYEPSDRIPPPSRKDEVLGRVRYYLVMLMVGCLVGKKAFISETCCNLFSSIICLKLQFSTEICFQTMNQCKIQKKITYSFSIFRKEQILVTNHEPLKLFYCIFVMHPDNLTKAFDPKYNMHTFSLSICSSSLLVIYLS